MPSCQALFASPEPPRFKPIATFLVLVISAGSIVFWAVLRPSSSASQMHWGHPTIQTRLKAVTPSDTRPLRVPSPRLPPTAPLSLAAGPRVALRPPAIHDVARSNVGALALASSTLLLLLTGAAARLSRPRPAPLLPPVAMAAATSETQAPSPPIRRVAIIGGGPSGLAAALALGRLPPSHRPTTIDVYDRRPDVGKAGLGGGLQLNGGAQVLARLGLGPELQEVAQECRRVRSRTVSGAPLLEIDIAEQVRRFSFVAKDLWRGDAAPKALEGDRSPAPPEDSAAPGLHSYTIMRDELQRILLQALDAEGISVQCSQDLVGFQTGPASATGVICCFADGLISEPYDLVIGADGVNSMVRQLCSPDDSSARASGIRIQFGVTPVEAALRPPGAEDELHQWFGDGLYVLTGTYGCGNGKRREMVASIFMGTRDAETNADWRASDVRQDCLRRLTAAGMPSEVVAVVKGCEQFFEVGVRDCDPLQPWVLRPPQADGPRPLAPGGRVVLLGDAAHAMPPFLGQGANQAIQDAFCLAQQLQRVDREGPIRTVDAALRIYESRRRPTTAVLLLESRFLGWLETGSGPGAWARDFVFWALGRTGVAGAVYVNGAVPRV